MGRNYTQFSLEERLEERGEIARLRANGQSLRQIATNLGRTASSVWRELKGNSGASVGYKPVYADDLAWGRRWRGSNWHASQLNQLGIRTYFCHPHSPWQKGGLENMNGRIRRYIPLKTKPDSFSDHDVQLLAARLNATSRKCLGCKTPAEVFSASLIPLHFKCESTSPPTRE